MTHFKEQSNSCTAGIYTLDEPLWASTEVTFLYSPGPSISASVIWSAEYGLKALRGDCKEDRFNLEVRRVTWRISVTEPFQTCKACAKADVTESLRFPRAQSNVGLYLGPALRGDC